MKRKPIDYRSGLYSECYVNSNDPNLKLIIMEEYQNRKTFLLRDILRFG